MLLDAGHLPLWLDGSRGFDESSALEVSHHPVSKRVGNTRCDDSELIAPVALDDPDAAQAGALFPEI
jgi:hypothetical protein